MNDLSIQGSRAYAAAYATNDVKTQAVAPAATAASASSQSSSDTVSISAEAKELFQQSSVTDDAPAAPLGGGDGGRPQVVNPPPIVPKPENQALIGGGDGGRPVGP